MTKAIVFSCAHADPDVSNERFDWLGKLIYDEKPDLVVDLGDGADMRSLNSYDDRNPKALLFKNYEQDIDSYNDSQERLRHQFRYHKKKRPFWVGMEGNHEYRIKKYLQANPGMEGSKHGVSFKHLQTDHWFDEYHEYKNNAPSIADYHGVSFAHYFSSGNYGTATSGRHHAYTLLANRHHSSTCGHSHKRGIYFQDEAHPTGNIGCVVGCYKGSEESWAGQANGSWWKGVVIKRELSNGMYEPQFVSLETLRKTYAT